MFGEEVILLAKVSCFERVGANDFVPFYYEAVDVLFALLLGGMPFCFFSKEFLFPDPHLLHSVFEVCDECGVVFLLFFELLCVLFLSLSGVKAREISPRR